MGTPAFPHNMSSVPRGHAWPRKQVASRFPVAKGWFEAIKASATTACPPQYTDFASSKHLGCCHWIWDSSHRGFPANSPTVLQRQTLGSFGTTLLLLNPLFNLTRSVRTRLFTTRPLGGDYMGWLGNTTTLSYLWSSQKHQIFLKNLPVSKSRSSASAKHSSIMFLIKVIRLINV